MKLKTILLEEKTPEERREELGDHILEKMGIRPYGYLGRGAYTFALACLYKNKKAVAKFTSEMHKKDTERTLKFYELKKTAPKKFKKFFMEIYEHSIQEYDGSRYDVIIAELLKPLNPILRDNIFRKYHKMGSDFSSTNTDQEIVEEILDKARENFSKFVSTSKLANIFIDQIEMAGTGVFKSKEKFSDFVKSLKNDIMKKSTDVDQAKLDMCAFRVRDFIEQEIFPDFPDNSRVGMKDLFKKIPETSEFVRFLDWLEKEKKINFADIHDENLMMRENGDIVLSDVGFFEFYS